MKSTAGLDKLVWALIFSGIVVFGLGLTVQRSDDTLGFVIVVIGALLFVAGAVALWLRSRIADKP